MELSKNFLVFSQKNTVLIFHKTETLKSFLYSLQRKHFLFFWKWKSRKKFFIFQETELSYSSGSNFQSLKSKKNPLLKNFLIFWEMELSSPKLKKLLIFQERTCKTWETNKKACSEEISCLLWRFHNLTANSLWSKNTTQM